MVRGIDPIIALTPYLMPMRCDAQVMLKYRVDYERMARYIVAKGAQGYKFSFMELVIAAYVRSISQLPELNRFIVNKRIYSRTELTCAFVVLQDTKDHSIKENVAKCKFDPHDTIFDVAARIAKVIEQNRKEEADNSTLKIAQILKNPLLANLVAGLARILDRYGLLPRFLVDASPFHTGMFVTNMASIGMPAVNHHIYNFGSVSLFISLGTVEREVELTGEGTPIRRRYLPVGVVADERICAGMVYSQMVSSMMKYMSTPELLEAPPEKVFFDEGNTYSVPQLPIKRRRRFARPSFRRHQRPPQNLAG